MSQPRVLVVDDEPQIRRALRLVLRANGYDVAADEEDGAMEFAFQCGGDGGDT